MKKKTEESKVVGEVQIVKHSKTPKREKTKIKVDETLVDVWTKALTDAKIDFDAGTLSLSRFNAIISAAREIKNLIIVDGLFGTGDILKNRENSIKTLDITDKAKTVKKNLLKK